MKTLSENVVSDLNTVEATLRQITPSYLEGKVLAHIPKWFLLIGLYKELERAYIRLEDREEMEVRYRAALVSILAFGENIAAGLQSHSVDLESIETTMGCIAANLRYLREKYALWFVPRNSDAVAATLTAIADAPVAAA